MPEGRYFQTVILTFFVALAVCPHFETALAQERTEGHGIVVLSDWPDDRTRETTNFDILPFIDSLSIAYRYRVTAGQPELSIVLEWTPSGDAIYDGEHTKLSELDGTPAIVGLDLAADVVSGGRRVGRFSLVVDSMIVEPSPDLIRIDLPDLNWENVFVDVAGPRAKELFEDGFELTNPVIVSAGFALFDGTEEVREATVERRDQTNRKPPRTGPRRPRNVSIYRHPGIVDIGFDLFWLIGPRERSGRASGDRPRENMGRGSVGGADRSRAGLGSRGVADRSRGGNSGIDEEVSAGEDAESDRRGRGADRADGPEGRGGDSESGGSERGEEADDGRERKGGRSFPGLPRSADDDDDDNDDDDDELIPYAVVAVAAAGALAVFGGTVGYYGSSRYAPIGLTSGYVGRDGGVLLQVAVNESLIVDDAGPKRLMGRILSFGDLFGSPVIQPALGAGALLTSDGDDVEYEPSISLGAVARHDMLMFYAGFDVWQNSPELSLAINLRDIGLWGRTSDRN